MSNERQLRLLRNGFVLCLLLFATSTCAKKPTEENTAGSPPTQPSIQPYMAPSASVSTSAPAAPVPPPGKTTLRLLAAGDVSFGRLVGQMLLRNPDLALFASMEPLFHSTDVRFVNLEGPISDRGTETVSQHNNLVFNGPPVSARVLARAGIDIVSTANNHAWDYGKKGLVETIEWLDKENVLHVGSGATLDDAWKPVILERAGFHLAFVAINDIWNQPHVPGHSARDHVAGMDQDKLVRIVRDLRARKDVDVIAVSYHGGVEYQDEPLARTRDVAIAAIDAGADVFLGHHPHVVQGFSFHQGRPIVYSLGNLLMRMTSEHPATEMGLAVAIEFEREKLPQLFACPLRIFGVDPIPLGKDPQRRAYEALFMQRLQNVTRRVGKAIVAPFDAEGCARVMPPTELP